MTAQPPNTPTRKRSRLYIWLAAFISTSLLIGILLKYQLGDFAAQLAALPIVLALVAALFQLVRDYSTFRRDIQLQARTHAFALAATSHMSEVVFDKHVEFSEAYIASAQPILGTLFQTGPHKETGRDMGDLHAIRIEWRLWLTTQMMEDLDKFEGRITDIGVKMRRYESLQSTGNHLEADKCWDLAYEGFDAVLRLKPNKDDAGNAVSEAGYAAMIEQLQRILGVQRLSQMRDDLLVEGRN